MWEWQKNAIKTEITCGKSEITSLLTTFRPILRFFTPRKAETSGTFEYLYILSKVEYF